jgi:hypothetical protein
LNGKVVVPKGMPIADWCDDAVLIEFEKDQRGVWIEPNGLDKSEFLQLRQSFIDNMDQVLNTSGGDYDVSISKGNH